MPRLTTPLLAAATVTAALAGAAPASGSVGRGRIGDVQTTFWLNQRDKVKLVTLARILYH